MIIAVSSARTATPSLCGKLRRPKTPRPALAVYRRPLANEPSLRPALTTNVYANTVVNQLFDGLVQFDSYLNLSQPLLVFGKPLDGLT